MTIIQAIIIAIIEGLTEFLPISSTAHMRFANPFLGLESSPFVNMFEVVIQFAAILSIVVIFYKKFFDFKRTTFYLKLIIAVIPALIVGAILKDYIDAAYNNAPYARIETIITRAFPGAPEPAVPNLTAKKADRIYEMRSYEGATEKLRASKFKMFNVGDEMAIFKKYDFNAVFYSEVIAGSHMPNLMYMTTFNGMDDNKAKWKLFFSDPAFVALGKMPEYQHNVSKAESFFLYPADYSDY